MASSKQLLPSCAALLQSSPVSSTPFFCDSRLFLPSVPVRPFQPLLLYTQLNDPSFLVRFSSDGEEAFGFGDEFTASDDESDDDEEEEKQFLTKNSSAGPSSAPAEAPAATSSSSQDPEGTLSKYVWSRPHKQNLLLSRRDREQLVESIVSTNSNFLMELDKARFKLSPSDFGNLLQRLIQEKKWYKVGLVIFFNFVLSCTCAPKGLSEGVMIIKDHTPCHLKWLEIDNLCSS